MDFRHPFITNYRIAIAYIAFWTLLAVILVLVVVTVGESDFVTAMSDRFVYIIFFGILGASIWYVIKFSTLEDNRTGRVILAHVIAATIIVFIWLYIGAVIAKLINPSQLANEESLFVGLYNGYLLYTFNVVFFYAVNYYLAYKEKIKNETKLKALVKEAELHALKSQINPHFLFNSLNSISSLTMTDPGKAQEMVINLSQLMRYSLKHDQSEKVSVKQEIENNKLYLSIEKVRFGKKLNPVFALEENCLQATIPNMILQPLYENAIKYGVYEATETIDVITHCRCVEQNLVVTISNTYDKNVVSKKGEGIGLRNIRDRLQVIYGNPHLMRIENKQNEFTVTLTIPQNL
ncbi:histidine kinase [uncultured Draconibacterium sp.]|uniref:sensor histidine kinase n=1 Tax=uncultured Draconibacterium sp. TaxID=1573823 RepID=UPI0025D4F57A|nr:histidine kinase [uncultured Draconibacterium sp.]